MSLEIGVLTTDRIEPTINRTLSAIRYGGYTGVIHIFQEPMEDRLYRDSNYWIHKNTKQLGCFGNFHNALTYLSQSTSDYIGVIGDDFEFSRGAFIMVEQAFRLYEKIGFLSMYTPQGMGARYGMHDGWQSINLGWKNTWGGNYIFPREVAKQIIKHPFYLDHLENYKANQQIDHCIPEVCHQLGLNQMFHVPSFSDHIGMRSTIGHKHTQNEKGFKFEK